MKYKTLGLLTSWNLICDKGEYYTLNTHYSYLEYIVKLYEKKTFPIMKKLAEKLSKGFIHLRVDFYEVDGKVYIGELTLNHGSGLMTFSPDRWYKVLGDWIKLPTDK